MDAIEQVQAEFTAMDTRLNSLKESLSRWKKEKDELNENYEQVHARVKQGVAWYKPSIPRFTEYSQLLRTLQQYNSAYALNLEVQAQAEINRRFHKLYESMLPQLPPEVRLILPIYWEYSMDTDVHIWTAGRCAHSTSRHCSTPCRSTCLRWRRSPRYAKI